MTSSGCASIVNGQNQSLSIDTKKNGVAVAGANCKLSNNKGVWYVTTPGTTTVHRSYEELAAHCEKEGQQVITKTLSQVFREKVSCSGSSGGRVGSHVGMIAGIASQPTVLILQKVITPRKLPIYDCFLQHLDCLTASENIMFKKTTFAFGVLLATGLISGCASTGNETLRQESETTMSQKILEGKTTKDEVRKMFGSPFKTSFTDGGLEIWNYEFSNVSADAVSYIPIVSMFGGSSSGKKKELVVMFDSQNVVKRFSMSESDVKHKTGLFNN